MLRSTPADGHPWALLLEVAPARGTGSSIHVSSTTTARRNQGESQNRAVRRTNWRWARRTVGRNIFVDLCVMTWTFPQARDRTPCYDRLNSATRQRTAENSHLAPRDGHTLSPRKTRAKLPVLRSAHPRRFRSHLLESFRHVTQHAPCLPSAICPCRWRVGIEPQVVRAKRQRAN